MTRMKNTDKIAFTLAETMITLAIIGVIAAITLPSIVQKHKERVTVTKVKKAYNIVNQAYLQARAEYGDVTDWFTEDSTTSKDDEGNAILTESSYANTKTLWEKLTPYMKVINICYSDDNNCNRSFNRYTLSGVERSISTVTTVELIDGMHLTGGWITISKCSGQKSYCGDFGVDINGVDNPPNTSGIDMFYFYISPFAIIPFGMPDDETGNTFSDLCLRNSLTAGNNNGYGCTAWVIYNGNMDYLHCDDLSWDGKHKCN